MRRRQVENNHPAPSLTRILKSFFASDHGVNQDIFGHVAAMFVDQRRTATFKNNLEAIEGHTRLLGEIQQDMGMTLRMRQTLFQACSSRRRRSA